MGVLVDGADGLEQGRGLAVGAGEGDADTALGKGLGRLADQPGAGGVEGVDAAQVQGRPLGL